MSYIDDFEEMEQPCRCNCGAWFDLMDGYASRKWFKNKTICDACHQEEAREIENDEKIKDFEVMHSDALHSLITAEKNLIRLNAENFVSSEKKMALDFYSWVCNQSVQGRTTEKLWIDYTEDRNS